MIETDDDWALQQRICAQPSFLRQIRSDDEFWDRQWSSLLRKACVGKRLRCLSLLLDVRKLDVGSQNATPPPLPKQFIGWLISGVAKNLGLNDLDRLLATQMYYRMAESDFSLTAKDGISILKNGGLYNTFYQARFQANFKRICECPSVILAWKNWCRRKANVDLAMDTLGGMLNSPDFRSGTICDALSDLVEGVPQKQRQEVLSRFYDLLACSTLYQSKRGTYPARMLNIITHLQEIDPEGKPEVITQWKTRLCHFLTEKSLTPRVGDVFIDLILVNHRNDTQTPEGIVWNKDMEAGLMVPSQQWETILDGRGNDMTVSDALEWLDEREKAWDKLLQWGLVQPKEKPQWNQAMNQALGDNWHAKIKERIDSVLAQKDKEKFSHLWTEWKRTALTGYVGRDLEQEEQKFAPLRPRM